MTLTILNLSDKCWGSQTEAVTVDQQEANTQPQTQLALLSSGSHEWSQELTFQMTHSHIWVWAWLETEVSRNSNSTDQKDFDLVQIPVIQKTPKNLHVPFSSLGNSNIPQKPEVLKSDKKNDRKAAIVWVLFSSYPAEQRWYQRTQLETFHADLEDISH